VGKIAKKNSLKECVFQKIALTRDIGERLRDLWNLTT